MWPFKTGDCLIEVTAWEDLTVFVSELSLISVVCTFYIFISELSLICVVCTLYIFLFQSYRSLV